MLEVCPRRLMDRAARSKPKEGGNQSVGVKQGGPPRCGTQSSADSVYGQVSEVSVNGIGSALRSRQRVVFTEHSIAFERPYKAFRLVANTVSFQIRLIGQVACLATIEISMISCSTQTDHR